MFVNQTLKFYCDCFLSVSQPIFSSSAFFYHRCLKKASKSVFNIRVLSIPSAFSGVSVWTLGEKKKNKYDALSNENGDEKSVLYVYCRLNERFRGFRCGRFVKKISEYDALSNKNALVWTGEGWKMLVWRRNYFALFPSK